MNKQIEALKLSQDFMRVVLEFIPNNSELERAYLLTFKAITEALAEAEKQEPVAWKGLTDVERQDIIKELSGYDSDANNNDVALWIEKALKEKNT